MEKNTALNIAASIAFVAMVTVNALANALPINGLTTGNVADLYPSLFTPAGFTFSIWSVIYLGLFCFLVYSWKQNRSLELRRVLLLFILTCILNSTWVLVWHHLLTAISVVVMLGLLVTLTRIFMLIHRKQEPHWLVSLPFTVYFAWICVATIANIAAYMVSVGWNGWNVSPEVWAALMTIAAAGIGTLVFVNFKTPAILAVILWAFAGIYYRWKDSDLTVLLLAIMLSAVAMLGVAFIVYRRRHA